LTFESTFAVLCSSVPMPRPRTATLFPYTTLFRSPAGDRGPVSPALAGCRKRHAQLARRVRRVRGPAVAPGRVLHRQLVRAGRGRSEEHTSELQSRENLVCRLLLEKKKRTSMR